MKTRVITFSFLLVVIVAGLSNIGEQSSSGQGLPQTNRKPACGCYCGGNSPGYYVFRDTECAGILAADACDNHFSSLPEAEKKEICSTLKRKERSSSCPLPKEIAEYCGKLPPDDSCKKPAPWFDTSTSSGCKDAQATQINIDLRTHTATVSMCGYQVLTVVAKDFANHDPLFRNAYTNAFKQSIPKRVCCDKFRDAARTGVPCDPRADVDCDGILNNADNAPVSSLPNIDVFVRPENAPVDVFPEGFDFSNPDFQPNSTARDSKGVGDCDCKWELIKGETKCNSVVDQSGRRQHVYIATWRCPSTKAEVFTTKHAPSTAPCQ